MLSTKVFEWIDGNYDIKQEQGKSGFYTITARCRRRGEVVFAATRATASACQKYVYDRIHV